MARPRIHDRGQLMDAAQALAVDEGAGAVTVRALSDLTGVSNGAIYHSFGSRSGLMASVWHRAADRFLQQQRLAVDASLRDADDSDAVAAVVAAADAPAAFLLAEPSDGRFLLAVSRSALIGSGDISEDLERKLEDLDRRLVDLFLELSTALWDRRDRIAVDLVRDCVVELPTALLLHGRRTPTDELRRRLAAAVRAVLGVGPPDEATTE